MGFYFRKAINLGPVRFNLSKSGIGTSVGATGFRVGVRPNGKSYVHAGRYGFYYREELGKGQRTSKRNQPQGHKNNEQNSDAKSTKYNSASSHELSPNSREDILIRLNESYKATGLSVVSFALFLIFTPTMFIMTSWGWLTLVSGIFVTYVLDHIEKIKRTITINYDFEDGEALDYQKIINAFNNLASNEAVWLIVESKEVSGTYESKLNAGANDLVDKKDVQIGSGNPPWVETNVSVPALITDALALYMMPDGILVYDDQGVGFVEYNDLYFNVGTTRFIGNSPASDAKIVGHTWQHPNKDGSPDKRFAYNPEIPVCLYGKLKISSSTGMFLYLMTSKADSPSNFVESFQGAIESSRSHDNQQSTFSDEERQVVRCPVCDSKLRFNPPFKVGTTNCHHCSAALLVNINVDGIIKLSFRKQDSSHKEGASNKATSSIAELYEVLGLIPSASPQEVKAAYRQKMREYHPDKVAGLGEKLLKVANEESKAINHAYFKLKDAGLAA